MSLSVLSVFSVFSVFSAFAIFSVMIALSTVSASDVSFLTGAFLGGSSDFYGKHEPNRYFHCGNTEDILLALCDILKDFIDNRRWFNELFDRLYFISYVLTVSIKALQQTTHAFREVIARIYL